MPLKALVPFLVHHLAYLSGFSAIVGRLQNAARIIMYHGVGGSDCPVDAFREQIRFIRDSCDPVSLAELLDRLDGRSRFSGDEVVVTFDDGLLNVVTEAYPILREFNVPAAYFVCPGLIEERRWLWSHDMRARLDRLTPLAWRSLADELGVASPTPYAIIEAMKLLPLHRRQAVEDEVVAIEPGFAPTNRHRLHFDIAGWDDLRSLDPELVTIGSHSMNHPVLTTLDGETMEDEIAGSRRRLEERLGRAVDYFCYPNGSENAAVRRCVAKHYRAALTTESGHLTRRVDRFRLPRVCAEDNPASLAWRLIRP